MVLVQSLWWQFLLQNLHFALNFFAALVFFAIFWLYFDAWQTRPKRREFPRLIGLLLIAVSYLIHATVFESAVIPSGWVSLLQHDWLVALIRLAGYAFVISNVITEPLPQLPTTKAVSNQQLAIFPLGILTASLTGLVPVASGLTGFVYLRRATVGLERHLKVVAYGFLGLCLADLLHLASLGQGNRVVGIYQLLRPFGPVWLLEHGITLVALVLLGRWVWQYLLKRLKSQLFMIFVTTIVCIFVITTLTFTGLLLRRLEKAELNRLSTDVAVLQLVIDSQKETQASYAQVIAKTKSVQDALSESTPSTEVPRQVTQQAIGSLKADTVIIVDQHGQVLGRGEEPDRTGDSLSNDPLIERALTGQSVTSVLSVPGVMAPTIVIRAATPIQTGTTVTGAVLVGTTIDNSLVDGIKKATGLEVAVYAENILSATTLTTDDGVSRALGSTLHQPAVTQQVLENKQPYAGVLSLQQTAYLVAIAPLQDVDGTTLGMIAVGVPQLSLLQTAAHAITSTFTVVVLLLVLALWPTYVVAKHLAYQLQ